MKDYVGSEMTVHWDAGRCIHFGICTRRLPSVFDITARPWINADGADADAIAEVIEACPTGALRYTGADGRTEQPPTPTRVRAIPGGPLLLHGDLVMPSRQGEVLREIRLAMCRCGRSANQPYCDNSHRTDVTVASPPPPPEPQNPAEICAPQPEAAGGA